MKIYRFSENYELLTTFFWEIRSSAFDLFCWALRLYTTWQVFDCTYADSTMLMGTFPIFVTFILHHGIQEERLIVMINMKDSLFAQEPFDYVINLDLFWQKSYLERLNTKKKNHLQLLLIQLFLSAINW